MPVFAAHQQTTTVTSKSICEGMFFWHDVMTTDTAAAKKFYKAVFGWGTKDWKNPNTGMEYTMLTEGETPVGGLMEIPAEAKARGARPCWMGYVCVDDVDAMTARIKGVGGTIHKEATNIPDVGRFAVVTDPQGAAFIIMKSSNPKDNQIPPVGKVGHVGWNELHAKDGKQVFDFYADMFGWTKEQAMDMGEMGVYQLFNVRGSQAFGAMMTKTQNEPVPFWLYYLTVEDIDDGIELVKNNGGTIHGEIMPIPMERFVVQCFDPQGAMFALLGKRRAK